MASAIIQLFLAFSVTTPSLNLSKHVTPCDCAMAQAYQYNSHEKACQNNHCGDLLLTLAYHAVGLWFEKKYIFLCT